MASLGYRRHCILSDLNLNTDEKSEREKCPLRLNGDGSKRIVIVSRVMRPYMDDGGILTMGLLDFLLGQDGLDHV